MWKVSVGWQFTSCCDDFPKCGPSLCSNNFTFTVCNRVMWLGKIILFVRWKCLFSLFFFYRYGLHYFYCGCTCKTIKVPDMKIETNKKGDPYSTCKILIAPTQDRTTDLQFTRLTLYHWAIGAWLSEPRLSFYIKELNYRDHFLKLATVFVPPRFVGLNFKLTIFFLLV